MEDWHRSCHHVATSELLHASRVGVLSKLALGGSIPWISISDGIVRRRIEVEELEE
jgi:hypothetical protein